MLKSTPSLNAWPGRVLMILALAAPLFLFLHFADAFPYAPEAAYSDFSISHYPNAVYLKSGLQTGAGVPLWSDQILGGTPFAADPLSSLWYPPAWAAVLFEQPQGLNLVIAAHLLLAGLGMYTFLRGRKLAWQAALAGAYAFELAPKLAAHYAAGHVTLIYAVCWTPWLLWAAQRGLRPGRWKFAPGLVLGLIVLADVRWAVPAAALWAAFSLAEARRQQVSWGRVCGLLAANGLLAAALSAPLSAPLLEYSQLSTRALLTPQDNLAFSLPPLRLAGLFIPDLGGNAEYVFYPGLLPLIFTAWGASLSRFWKENLFWVGVLGVALLVALGNNLPLLSNLATLPLLNLLRVPSRVLFLVSLCFAIFLAWTINVLLGGLPAHVDRRGKPRLPGNVLLPVGLGILVGLLAAGFLYLTGSIPLNLALPAAGALLALVLLYLRLAGGFAGRAWWAACIGLAVLEGGLIANLSLEFRPAAEVLGEQQAAAGWLDANAGPGPFRIYSPSYSMPQQVAAGHGFELADGIDPLQLRTYANFMGKAAGFSSTRYSVTLPPFLYGDPLRDNVGARLDAQALGLLNVRFVLSAFDLQADNLVLRVQEGGTRIYENSLARPRAWVDAGDGSGFTPASGFSLEANQIEVQAQGPGRLVLAEVDYPGWQAELDGTPVPIQSAYGLLRAVQLPGGAHTVRFIFRPPWVTLGLILAGLALLIFGVLTLQGEGKTTPPTQRGQGT